MMIDQDRAADLHFAYQHGEATAKGEAGVFEQFRRIFGDDAEANAEYQRGLAEQLARKPSATVGVP
jgi:hypothetical protein